MLVRDGHFMVDQFRKDDGCCWEEMATAWQASSERMMAAVGQEMATLCAIKKVMAAVDSEMATAVGLSKDCCCWLRVGNDALGCWLRAGCG